MMTTPTTSVLPATLSQLTNSLSATLESQPDPFQVSYYNIQPPPTLLIERNGLGLYNADPNTNGESSTTLVKAELYEGTTHVQIPNAFNSSDVQVLRHDSKYVPTPSRFPTFLFSAYSLPSNAGN